MNKIAPLIVILSTAFFLSVSAQTKMEPWKASQLARPEHVAEIINAPTKDKPLIISVGPSALIKGSVETGPAQEKENLDKLQALLAKQPKDREIIIYCGCCPFDRCPNIRPAFALLTEMQFSRPEVLDLPHNLKADWIDKGYPINE
jgi:thiosulfate/3-mercaptopyruvate sulfurtransferase